jgi:predicted RNA binding protein YcfA (HicA-like mRNA interferase family)
MPRLRRLSGKEVIKIFQDFGFEVYSQRGSHIRLQRTTPDGQQQRLLIAVHGSKEIRLGTLKSIYNNACRFIPEEELRPYFYTE